MHKKGILIIISGPSGVGKGTVIDQLVKKGNCCLSISVTTRPPRSYEIEGKHYFFRTAEEFQQMAERDELIEWACFCGNYYGTPKSYVYDMLEQGKNVILEIEVVGALKLKEKVKDMAMIFMLPPSIGELKDRLLKRETENLQVIESRIQRAKEEIKFIQEYDYLVLNDTIEKAVAEIGSIVTTEKLKVERNKEFMEKYL